MNFGKRRRPVSNASQSRRGAASVEVALTAPIVFAVVFGLMEWTRFENIRQATATATFNAARTGTIPGSTTQEMENAADDILQLYSIVNSTVDANITATESTVEISVPIGDNSWFLKTFVGSARIKRDFALTHNNPGS